MTVLLTIDLGNTSSRVGLFVGRNLRAFLPWSQTRHWVGKHPFVLSSVRRDVPDYLQKGFSLERFWQGSSFAGMPVDYTRTLGQDRLVQAAYLFNRFKGDALLIDAGTFITVDRIGGRGFLGGYILPGVRAWLGSYSAGDRLPELSKRDLRGWEGRFPRNTDDAVGQAVSLGYRAFFRELLSKFQFDHIVFTGGDGAFLSRLVDMGGAVRPNLIHHALYFLSRGL